MDYINYVKQSPVQGLTGLWGGVQGSVNTGGGSFLGVPDWQGGRGFIIGGYPSDNAIYSYTHDTPNSANDFADLTLARGLFGASASNANRICTYGGLTPSLNAVIDYFTSTTASNASAFGDLTSARWGSAGTTNGTRGVISGSGDNITAIDYITFANTGNATNFGTMNKYKYNLGGTASHQDNARGMFVGGRGSGPDSEMSYITITTTGNSQDFGDLTQDYVWPGVSGNGARAIVTGGSPDDTAIDYFAIMTTGNSSDFGDLSNNQGNAGNSGNGTYVVSCTADKTDRVTVATTGNASDFGPGSSTNYPTGSSGDPS